MWSNRTSVSLLRKQWSRHLYFVTFQQWKDKALLRVIESLLSYSLHQTAFTYSSFFSSSSKPASELSPMLIIPVFFLLHVFIKFSQLYLLLLLLQLNHFFHNCSSSNFLFLWSLLFLYFALLFITVPLLRLIPPTPLLTMLVTNRAM